MTTLYDLPLRDKKEKRMNKFWVNWVEGTDGGRRYRWYSLVDAQVEAERLARLPDVMGRNVYVFECIGRCRVESLPIRWDEFYV
uniref:Uncharacterized protein n=1 Tax=viral metagenome TaxID=1070528 RepID=A0A6M3JGP5_9ZZZZ